MGAVFVSITYLLEDVIPEWELICDNRPVCSRSGVWKALLKPEREDLWVFSKPSVLITAGEGWALPWFK